MLLLRPDVRRDVLRVHHTIHLGGMIIGQLHLAEHRGCGLLLVATEA